MKPLLRALSVFAFLFLLAGAALAAGAPPKDDEGFVPVNGDQVKDPGESLPASKLVGGAYGFICVALIAWVASVAQRSRKLEDEVEALKKKLG